MARPTFSVFITGGTGYLGTPLIRTLLQRGHSVRALVRPGSEKKLPPGAEAVLGNALDATSYAALIQPSHTFVQLVGVAHPSPAKTAEFQAIDRESALGAIFAAQHAGVKHFIYVSVAQPAPVMKSYQRVRAECETALLESGGNGKMNVTIVRPWYVLGPGHRWPYVLLPMYWLFERIPSTRDGARRLGLVTLAEMTQTLAAAVENPSIGARFIEVPQIRTGSVLA